MNLIGEDGNILFNFTPLFTCETQNSFMVVCHLGLVYSGSLPFFYHILSFGMKWVYFLGGGLLLFFKNIKTFPIKVSVFLSDFTLNLFILLLINGILKFTCSQIYHFSLKFIFLGFLLRKCFPLLKSDSFIPILSFMIFLFNSLMRIKLFCR